MVENRIHAVLHRRGILVGKSGLFTSAGREIFDALALDEAARTAVNRVPQYNATFERVAG